MSKYKKLLKRILSGESDNNINFDDMCYFLKSLGFEERVRGSHHIFYKTDIAEIINIQPLSGCKSKSYQVKQVREMLLKYKLGGGL